MSLLQVENLQVHYPGPDAPVRAVDGITFRLEAGETFALVGESGCGKSATGMAILRLVEPGRIVAGRLLFEQTDLMKLTEKQMRKIRGARIGMVFQEPAAALNPVMRIGSQVSEALRIHQGLGRREARREAVRLLGVVALPDPEGQARAYPHELSGGMMQRVMLAIALSCSPSLLIADEPTTALDVTIQAQILQLMKDLTHRLGVALVIITHNLGAVARYADRVNVMYAGKFVESGTTDQVFAQPRHPYAIGLLNSVPRMDREAQDRLVPIEGQPPDLKKLDDGCSYRPRCRWVIERCASEFPPLEDAGDGQVAACWRMQVMVELRKEAS